MSESAQELPNAPARGLTHYAVLITAVLVGALLSAVLSSALVLVGLRAGITPGVSPLIVLVAWMLLAPFLKRASRGGQQARVGMLLLQTTGSAGAAVTAGVIFTAPILQIAAADGIAPAVAIYPLLYAAIAGALLGWACVGISTKRMLYDMSLPAPEAQACSQILDLSQTDRAQKPPLVRALLLPAVFSAGCTAALFLKGLKAHVAQVKIAALSLPLPISPLYFGIGAILSIETAALLAGGAVGHSIVRTLSTHYHWPDDTFRWVGAGAMTVSIVYTLCAYVYSQWQSYQTLRKEAQAQEVEVTSTKSTRMLSYWLYLALGFAIAMTLYQQLSFLSVWSFSTVVPVLLVVCAVLVLGLLLSAVGALLSLQVGSSSSPVSGTVFVAMLFLAGITTFAYAEVRMTALVYLLVSLCVAVCAANDSSQDYRTLHLQGYPISLGYVPQLIGLLSGAVVVPATLWVAHESFYLGGSELPAPQASFFSLVLLSILEDASKPLLPILSGAGLGLLAVLLEILAKRHKRQLSSVSFCVGLYLPPSIGMGILLGALARIIGLGRWAAQGSAAKPMAAASGILAAAVFLSMDAAVSLGFGVASIFGWWIPGGSDTLASAPLSVAVFLLLLLYLSYCFRLDARSDKAKAQ